MTPFEGLLEPQPPLRPDKDKEVLNDSLDVEAAQDHLDNAPVGYLDAINEVDPEELVKHVGKVQPLQDYASDARFVVSIGVGGGLEVRALRHLFPDESKTRVIGLDLSTQAIASATEYLRDNGIKAELIHGSALDMPFAQQGKEVDGLVFSAILHEVYSYVPDGKRAWKKALQEAFRNLAPGGVLVLRDFAAPEVGGQVEIELKTPEASEFYEYFRKRYRTFETWEEDAQAMQDRRVDFDDFPAIAGDKVTLDFRNAAEMMTHFRNYMDHIGRGILEAGDPAWKEIDECYLVPNPDMPGINRMSPIEYAAKVVEIGNEFLGGRDSIVFLKNEVAERPDTAEFMQYHFGMKMDGFEGDEELFKQIPRKMEYALKKK